MNKKQIIKQFFYRALNPTPGDKRFQIAALLCALGLLLAGFGRILAIGNNSSSVVFDWFVYVSMVSILIVMVAAIVWRVRDIVKQMEANEHNG